CAELQIVQRQNKTARTNPEPTIRLLIFPSPKSCFEHPTDAIALHLYRVRPWPNALKNASNPCKKPNSVGFFSRELHPAREPVHYFAAVSPVNRPHKFDRLAASQISGARKAEPRRFFSNAKKASF